jgi:hypothetical protein
MTIRISADFSSFVVVDEEQKSYVVPLDPSRDTTPSEEPAHRDPDWVAFPAFVADPGSQLISPSAGAV